jgi:hypothetical protein
MYPITTKNQAKVTLSLGDEESSDNHLASDSKLHGENTLGAYGLATSNTTDGHVRLDQLNILATNLLEQ